MQAIDHNGTCSGWRTGCTPSGSARDPLTELLVAGSAAAVDERARALWRDMTALRDAGPGEAVILTALGWAIYVVGVALALWWTISSSAPASATVGDVAVVIALAGNLQDQIMHALSSRVRVAEAGRVIDHYLWLEERTSRLPEPDDRCRRSGTAFGWSMSRSDYPGAEARAGRGRPGPSRPAASWALSGSTGRARARWRSC